MRVLVPEVVQSSGMDCGPASLKCLLEGFGVHVSYGRLREACQTDVDGTSIDTLEEVAVMLGLDAEQVVVPVDHVLLDEGKALPAIAVVRLPNGITHFVVVWRRHGGLVQIMDPAGGRRWVRARKLLEELYVHAMPVAAAEWREWAASEDFLVPLGRRLADLGLASGAVEKLIRAAMADEGFESLARLDAATRMVAALVRAGGVGRGREAKDLIEQLTSPGSPDDAIPRGYFTALATEPDEDGEAQVILRGAVLVRARGVAAAAAEGEVRELSEELAAAAAEPPPRPLREVLGFLRQDGILTPTLIALSLVLSAAGVVFEALLFRSIFDLVRDLGVGEQRLAAAMVLVGVAAFMMLLEYPKVTSLLRLGRRLEGRVRLAFLDKLPRLRDRYFHSRLTSDMAERSHSMWLVRRVPTLGAAILTTVFTLVLTTVGIAWLDPRSAGLAAVVAIVAAVLPLSAQRVLAERDLRVRTHLGALSRFYLDALLGMLPIRTHGAARAVRREHEALLLEWGRAGLGLQRAAVSIDGLLSVTGFGLAAWLLYDHLSRGGEAGSALLLVYWALALPVLGRELAELAAQVPTHRNVVLRVLEPLGAPDDGSIASAEQVSVPAPAGAAAIAMENVHVRAGGHTILEGIDLRIDPGEHVAVVGPSGAGKSSLVGLLLGWHLPAAGSVRVDGEVLRGAGLEHLRQHTAWVDPAVQLWNRTLLDNLRYGADDGTTEAIADVVESAQLRSVLEQLPDGFQTRLGESGALVSGGEGQRVRLGRAMLRRDVRLAILDEPFRGLDRERRRELLRSARGHWKGATLLCVTHDVGETREFDRVIVIERGKVMEDDAPTTLAAREGSRYCSLLDAEAVATGLWQDTSWRHLHIEGGELHERASA